MNLSVRNLIKEGLKLIILTLYNDTFIKIVCVTHSQRVQNIHYLCEYIDMPFMR